MMAIGECGTYFCSGPFFVTVNFIAPKKQQKQAQNKHQTKLDMKKNLNIKYHRRTKNPFICKTICQRIFPFVQGCSYCKTERMTRTCGGNDD